MAMVKTPFFSGLEIHAPRFLSLFLSSSLCLPFAKNILSFKVLGQNRANLLSELLREQPHN